MDILIAILVVALVYWLLTSVGISLWYLLLAIGIAIVVIYLLRSRRTTGTF